MTIDAVDARRLVNQRSSQLQNENYLAPNEPLRVDYGYSWRKTSQGVLYGHLIETQSQRMLDASKRKADESRVHFSPAKLWYKNWLSVMNPDSGAWLSAGLSPKLFVMSNNEFISAVCGRNAVEDPMVPKYTPFASRESYAMFQCGCDGGAQLKFIDPFGYHMVGCKVGANTNTIRLHDEVVLLLAKLRLDAIVEPIRLFAEASGDRNSQRPVILLRNPRGFGRQENNQK